LSRGASDSDSAAGCTIFALIRPTPALLRLCRNSPCRYSGVDAARSSASSSHNSDSQRPGSRSRRNHNHSRRANRNRRYHRDNSPSSNKGPIRCGGGRGPRRRQSSSCRRRPSSRLCRRPSCRRPSSRGRPSSRLCRRSSCRCHTQPHQFRRARRRKRWRPRFLLCAA